MEAFIKDPNSIKDYTWDWTSDLGGDTVLAAQVTALPSDLTISAPTITSTHVSVNISGGVLGVKYRVTCRVSTNNSRTFDKLITILCQEE
jgi:hypothetical protein